MKSRFLIFALVLLCSSTYGQAPQKFAYQAVLRDISGNPITDEVIDIQVSLLQDNPGGSVVYVEQFEVTTNNFGLISLPIGSGSTLSGQFDTIAWGYGPYFIKIEIDDGGGGFKEISTTQLISVPYSMLSNKAISLTKPLTVPIMTTEEIVSLLPNEGEIVLNSEENLYQIYNNDGWVSIPVECWPLPTSANGGVDQFISDNSLSTNISGNNPEANHGVGEWSIISGSGGSFEDDSMPNTTFYGNECSTYVLQWSISTSCKTSTDEVMISFFQEPTHANAGPDQSIYDGTISTNLNANAPTANHGIGKWTIIIGVGGSFSDVNNPNSLFTGSLYEDYTLRWSISTPCDTSIDEVSILYWKEVPGPDVTDIEGNQYKTTSINGVIWMAENLKTRTYKDGSPIAFAADTIWSSLETPGYGWMNNDSSGFGETYGVLYNWHAVNTNNLCPLGWSVPDSIIWVDMFDFLGGKSVAGGKLKEVGTIYWNTPNVGATNEYGFTALPNDGIGDIGRWWNTSDIMHDNLAGCYMMFYNFAQVDPTSNWLKKNNFVSVRCVKDVQ